MWAYVIRRLLYSIPTVFGVALIVFILFNMVGGDPTLQMIGKHANPQQIAELRAELGFDQPKYVQFFQYLKQIITFDYGRSYTTKEPIGQMISNGLGPSFSLAALGLTMTIVLAIGLALLVAYYRGRAVDKVVVVLCVAGMSISALAFILFGQYILAYKLGWFHISGYESSFPARLEYLIMPALIWVAVSLGTDVRFFRTAILDETSQDYVRTARAKGLAEKWIFFKHVLKNSLIPIVTYVMIQMPYLILGALLLENFFGIPGLGSITVDAFNNQDFPVMKAMTTVISIIMILGNLATDVIYTWVDPRVSFK